MKLPLLYNNWLPVRSPRAARLPVVAAALCLFVGCWSAPAHAQESRPNTPVGGESRAEAGARTNTETPKEQESAKGQAKISIEQPTWITPLLKQFWFSGGAELTADGADAPASELVGKKIGYRYEDEESEAHRVYSVSAVIKKVGDAKPAPGAKTEEVTVDGRPVRLVNPVVVFPLAKAFPEQIVISILTAICILLVGIWMVREGQRVPGRKQMIAEMIYASLDNFVHGLIGEHYKKYVPLVATAFIYIFVMNVIGIIPGWKSPTSNVNVTAAMALVVVLYVQYEGIRVNGFGGYLKHFLGEPLWLAPLNFPLHIIGEFAKLLSLTIRLFGNIFGEDVVIVILTALGIMFTRGIVPFQFPMYFFAIFTSFVQAMVFSILACVYIALMTSHEDHEGHGHHAHGDDGGHIEESAGFAPATPA